MNTEELTESTRVSSFQSDTIYAIPILFMDPGMQIYSNRKGENDRFILHSDLNCMFFAPGCMKLP